MGGAKRAAPSQVRDGAWLIGAVRRGVGEPTVSSPSLAQGGELGKLRSRLGYWQARHSS